MARASLEIAKTVVGNLLAEQDRDREFMQGLLNHTVKMADQLAVMREHEERRIDEEAAQRKAEIHSLFTQLMTFEAERQQRLESYLADIDGQYDDIDEAVEAAEEATEEDAVAAE
ncbi:MAG: hypothetical protein HKN11_19275 [Rhizobiales bacterium]|nr:hypothetical protein [Hyphomicrobiales bacterium]